MKLLTRSEFLKLEPGCIYQHGYPGNAFLSMPLIKGATLYENGKPVGFQCHEMVPLEIAVRDDRSFAVSQESYREDSMMEVDYLVYESEDRMRLGQCVAWPEKIAA